MFALNLPNVLTVLRILLVPVLVVALLDETPDGDLLAAIVFAVASLTDALDGYLARARKQVSDVRQADGPAGRQAAGSAALIALVSLHRLEAWVAMVIIAREFTVTVLRMAANQRGRRDGRESARQGQDDRPGDRDHAADRRLGRPLWLDLAVYGMVGITVLSGADYFFGLRKRIEARRSASGAPAAPESGSAPAPSSHSRIVVCAARARRAATSSRSSPSRPWRSAMTLCWWIVSRFSWRAETKVSSGRWGRR